MVLLLFDIDGTLLTSDGVGRRSIEEALSKVCKRPIDASGVTFSGRTDPAIVREILTHNALSPSEVADLIPSCLDAYASLMSSVVLEENVSLLPGVSELLDAISLQPDYHLSLLTGNLEHTAWLKLKAGRIHQHFSFGAYGSDHEDRNQLPEIAHKRAKTELGIDFHPEKLIVIGDTEHDIACSRFFGARCIAVSTGMISHEDLHACEPDLLLPSLSHLDEVMNYLDDIAQI
ncbi:MAG: HAD hydrolase-like protein [Rhodothermales bacterium]|nr:HAD hydrolase-like protein [Rhodothermales bacterium]MDG2017689.1 HAD hydrolase-like protein [Rhodothermales bacterium]HAY35600.1 HAD family hydrolase [Bacteroidota bacterium]